MKTQVLIAGWLLFNVFAAGAYDVYLIYFRPGADTVSDVFQEWFHKWAMLAIAVGTFIGHIGWPVNRSGQPHL